MLQLDIRCRHDGLAEFFKKNCRYSDASHKHFPFLVFETHDYSLEIVVVTEVGKLMLYPNNTQVMKQWPGNNRSDYFKFTMGELREYLKGNPGPIQPSGWGI